MATIYEHAGISIIYADPLCKTGRMGYLGTLTSELNSYQHSIASEGGYVSAQFSIPSNPTDLEGWLGDGLGRHIQTFNSAGEVIWEGFVNEIDISFGPLSIKRGPLMNIANRLTVLYSDFTTGSSETTTVANDTDSQDRYGIIHKVLSTGRCSSTTANSLRDTYLAENSLPETSQTLASQSGDLAVNVSCLGYVKWLEAYPYNNGTVNTYTLREKVIEVLSSDPNGIMGTNYTQIEPNTLSVFETDEDNRIAYNIIKELVAMGGDANNNRRTFQIYADRRPYLQEIASVIEYQMNLSGTGPQVENVLGDRVNPWDVKPAKWLMFTDFLVGLNPTGNLREDPRAMFIERVTYNAPFDVTLEGGKVSTLKQQLAKLGLGGV